MQFFLVFLAVIITVRAVQDFDAIRPYEDTEVPAVVRRLIADEKLVDGIAGFLFPRLYRSWRNGAGWLTRRLLQWRARQLTTVENIQLMMRRYIDVMITNSVTELSSSGLDKLPPGLPRLFVSNHRDIVLDTVFLNRVLHGADQPTCRMAVGDNLLSSDAAADIMRLNKSFVVERSAQGTKAIYKALLQTSSYIRASLAEGQSVWIAQRAGRAKDGFDRSDPALLKMLALAYRKDAATLGEWLEQVCLIPVSISYELDPCDLLKAQELLQTQEQGSYEKPIDADLDHMLTSVRGNKGRVHIAFGDRITGEFESAEALAVQLDTQVVANLIAYPTHEYAQARLHNQQTGEALQNPQVAALAERIDSSAPELQPLVLAQYANLLRNRVDLGLAEAQP